MRGTAPRFDVAAHKEMAGAKVYERGVDYHARGLVKLLDSGPQRVAARVHGTEDYRVKLTGRGKAVDGDCSCPAFEDFGFCKHMVATALAANGAPGAGPDALAAVKAHLARQPAGKLATLVLQLAEEDDDLLRRLELAALADAAPAERAAQLKAALTKATAIGRDGYIGYGQAKAWAQGAGDALAAVHEFLSPGTAEAVMALAAHAIERIGEALNGIDDSAGRCGGLLWRAAEIHGEAAAAPPGGIALARWLFAREMADPFGVFDQAIETYGNSRRGHPRAGR